MLKNTETYQSADKKSALTYGNLTIEDLVNKDSDADGILDWEEGLYGLDPNKSETLPGTPDREALNKLRSERGGAANTNNEESQSIKKLTKTDEFSRELFATIAAATQNGAMSETAVEELSNSLANQIQNSPPRKVFSIFEIKTDNDSIQALKSYNEALANIYKKYPPANYTILDVLQKFATDEDSIDTAALVKLDPIISQTNEVINAMLKTKVPRSISALHLNVINSQERLLESISDIKLYEDDAIVALGGISKYQDNATRLETDLKALAIALGQKLKN